MRPDPARCRPAVPVQPQATASQQLRPAGWSFTLPESETQHQQVRDYIRSVGRQA